MPILYTNVMFASNQKIRVRFAPSPTGYLHVGGARTALYNWLFTRKNGGVFILRIEDTDRTRSTEEATKAILDGLSWLGMDWDEGPFYQTKRLDLYKKYSEDLIKGGKVYTCYCTTDELKVQREKAQEHHEAPRYSGKCRNLSPHDINLKESSGCSKVLRFKTPTDGITTVKDLIRKDVKFENNLLDDFVIVKSDGFPTYNFAAVVDDHLMDITHVIRGDDHLSNTPRQILLYEVLGFEIPKFAHIPMILGADKTRLSKRHSATSVIIYKDMGYLPEAIINYLARLGWGYKDQEIFSKEELIELFDIERVHKTSAVFDMDKLNWLNSHYINQSSLERLYSLTKPFLTDAYPQYLEMDKTSSGKEKINKIISCLKERMKTIKEIVELSDFFFLDEINYNKEAVEKHLKAEGVMVILTNLRAALSNITDFNKENIESSFRNLAKDMGIKAGAVIHPARVTLTGRSDSPPMFDTVEIIGKDISIKRIDSVLDKLKNNLL